MNAVTNFDLSTYIRWLKPEPQTPPACEEPQTQRVLPVMPFNNFGMVDEPVQPFLNYNNSIKVETSLPQKQEVSETNFPFSPTTKSSPTALGLLFQSSIFRDLVQKNLNCSDEEDDTEDKKCQPQMINGEEYNGVFYGTGDNFPFMVSPSYNL